MNFFQTTTYTIQKMPQVSKTELSAGHAIISIAVDKSEYQELIKKKLKELTKTAQIKGFRPGQVPADLIRTRFGTSVLADEVVGIANNAFGEYIEESKLSLLGEPLPAEEGMPRFDFRNIEDSYTLKFEIGFIPEFEIKGMSASDTYTLYNVTIPAERVDEEIAEIKRRNGQYNGEAESVVEGDTLSVTFEELENDEIKAEGIRTVESLLRLEDVTNEALHAQILAASKGDSFIVNVATDLYNGNQDHVRKYILQVDNDATFNETFRVTITGIRHWEAVTELTQDILDKEFGAGRVTNEEEARKLIIEDIEKAYANMAQTQLGNEVFVGVLEKNNPELPKAFLTKWMKAVSNDKTMTPEEADSEYERTYNSFKWQVMKTKLIQENNIRVTSEEMDNGLIARIQRAYGFFDPQYMGAMLNNLRKNESLMDELFREVQESKVMQAMAGGVTTTNTSVTLDEFKELNQAILKRSQAIFGANEEVAA